jgi:hypothetical protein
LQANACGLFVWARRIRPPKLMCVFSFRYFFLQLKIKSIKINKLEIYMGYYFIKYCLVLIFFPNEIIIFFVILACTYFEQLLLIVFMKII